MELFTIGFTKKSAEQFFQRLSRAGVRRLIDVRLNNISQLAGFSKREDLQFFLKAICNIDYSHLPELAPTQGLLDQYKKHTRDWPQYAESFCSLLSQRHVEVTLDRDLFCDACLLCSEDKPDHCHRRLVAEYLQDKWGDIQIRHL